MKRIFSLVLAAIICVTAALPCFAANKTDPAEKATDLKKYYRATKTNLESSEETLVFAATYLLTENVSPFITEIGEESSAFDLAKRICEIIALKKNPADDEGQNVVALLAEKQQENGSFENNLHDTLYSVIALQAANAEYNRDNALAFILSQQKDDGSFAYTDDGSDVITATSFALSVISVFRHESKTNYDAAENALQYLESNQNEDGGFSSSGVSNCMETARALLAAADMEKQTSENWIKALDTLASFRTADGSYSLVTGLEKGDAQSTVFAMMAFEGVRYGASVYKTLATNKTIAPSFSWEYFKPIFYVLGTLAGLSVIFWIVIFVRKPKTRTLDEAKRQTEQEIEIAEEYIAKQKEQKENEEK